MNGLLGDPRFGVSVVVVLMALVTWIAKNHARRLETLEREAVRQCDLDLLREESDTRHAENSKKMDNIQSGVNIIHARIDSLYRDLLNRD